MVLGVTDQDATMHSDHEREMLHTTSRKLLEVLPKFFKQMMSQCRDLIPSELGEFGDTQFALVHMLMHEDCTISELARRMKVTAPTVSRMVDGMVGRGLVSRRPDAADRRIIWVGLTDHGQAVSRHLEQVFYAVAARFMQPLSDEQLNTVITALETLQSLLHTEQQPTNRQESNLEVQANGAHTS